VVEKISWLHRQWIVPWRVATTIAASILASLGPAHFAAANISEYDAASGLAPQAFGWAFTDQLNPPATTSVAGGILTFNSGPANRAYWQLFPVPATSGNDGAFMEATMRVVSEQHTGLDRGASLISLGHADGAIESNVDLYAWEDRIFLNDFDDNVVGTQFLDTTDAFHTYRVELLRTQFWVFVDDQLVFDGTTPVGALALNGVQGTFGDGSAFSASMTQWTKVLVGSLADIGGPTVPEPATCVLAGLALVALAGRRRSRR